MVATKIAITTLYGAIKGKTQTSETISATFIAELGKGGNVNTVVLIRTCNALNCDVEDIMEFKKDDAQENEKLSGAGKVIEQ